MTDYRNCRRVGDTVTGEKRDGPGADWRRFEGTYDLLIIDLALWKSDESFARMWDLQDGYGEAGFTPSQGYDWSGIRDSSPTARAAMVAVAREYVSDDEFAQTFGLTPDRELAEALIETCHKFGVKGFEEGEIELLEREDAVVERLDIDAEQGLPHAGVERIEAFVSEAVGRKWSYEDAGLLGTAGAR